MSAVETFLKLFFIFGWEIIVVLPELLQESSGD